MAAAFSAEGVLIVTGVFLFLTIFTVALRLYARRRQHLPLKADDYFAVLALLGFIGTAICQIILVDFKVVGYAENVKQKHSLATGYKLEIAWDICGTICLACIKLSAVYFYRRIFCVTGKRGWFEWLTLATIGVIVVWFLLFCLLAGFQCGPKLAHLWEPGGYTKYCTISFPYLYSYAVSDFILDCWILILPIPRVMQLRASLSKKLSIIGVFILAFVGLGASIARMVEYILVQRGGPSYFIYHDQEHATTVADFVQMLELGVSLFAVNLPSLWLLMTSVVPEKVTRGLRSFASLTSLGSSRRSGSDRSTSSKDSLRGQHTRNDEKSGWNTIDSARPSESSHIYGGPLEAQKTEVYAEPGESGVPQLPPQAIRVQSSTTFQRDRTYR